MSLITSERGGQERFWPEGRGEGCTLIGDSGLFGKCGLDDGGDDILSDVAIDSGNAFGEEDILAVKQQGRLGPK